MRYSRFTNCCAIAGLILLAPGAMAADAELEVKRVAIFSSGVAYFEAEATVEGDASAELRFRTDQINDILKSLVVQDLSGGSLGAVNYTSLNPLEKALQSFSVDLAGNPSLAELLVQLRGERVQVSGPTGATGTILGVERRRVAMGDETVEVPVVNILADAGIKQLRIDQLESVEPLNPRVAGELRQALAVIANRNNAEKKSVQIDFRGQGQRRVRVAYLLEAPIWKTSYRLVVHDDKCFIQGWATVENATEDDWQNVQLALISGRPISFRMDLYTPLYVPRPVEELELYTSLKPPEFDAGYKQEGFAEFARRAARARAPSPAGKAEARGGGQSIFEDADDEYRTGMMLERLRGGGVQSVASARDAGELFAYEIDAPVTLQRQQAAMLPIVNQDLEGEKVSIYNQSNHPKHPLDGLELKNTTGVHLQQGPVAVFDDGMYAGDAMLPDFNRNEERLIAYALDLGMEVSIDAKPAPTQGLYLRIAKGTLIRTLRDVDHRVYTIRNKHDKAEDLIVEQPYSADWKLLEPENPYERTDNLLRFRYDVPAGATVSKSVKLERTREVSVGLSDVGLDSIRFYLNVPEITPELEQALEHVIELRTQVDRTERELAQARSRLSDAMQQQERVRENLRTLNRGSDAYRRQEEKFNQFETDIEQARRDVQDLEQQLERQRRELENYLLNLNIE